MHKISDERLAELRTAFMKAVPVDPQLPDGAMKGELSTDVTPQEIVAMAQELQSLRRSGGVAVNGLTASTAIKDALRELDNVTAFSDEDANCLGCAENLLRQALSTLSTLSPEGEPVAWLVERLHQGQVTSAEFTVISRYAQECLSAGSRVTPLYASPHELIEVTQEMVDAGYKAAEEVLRGTSADIGAGELDRLVRATLRAASPPGPAEVTDETVERLFQAAVPFMAGTAYRELRAALTAALKREGE